MKNLFKGKLVALHKSSEVKVGTVINNADNFYEMVLNTIKYYYRNYISTRTKLSQQKMRLNKRATGYAPLGYLNIRKDKSSFVVLDFTISDKVAELFNKYATQKLSLDDLVIEANNLGLKGKYAKKPLTKSDLKRILSNPFYCGYSRHNGKVFEHRYQKLIEEDLFNKCQEKLVSQKHNNM